MKALITSAASDVGRLLVKGLGDALDLVATDLPEVADSVGATSCPLDADEATRDLVTGVDAIVHVAGVSQASADAFGRADNAAVDYHSRCTYNLLTAAAEAGVDHVVYLSSLLLFADCDASWDVTEVWQPRPTTEIETMRHAIGEFTCREFARERKIKVTCLRIGTPGNKEAPFSGDRLFNDDLVTAVRNALDRPPSAWAIYHVQSDVEGRRFNISKAVEVGLFEGGRS